MKNNFTRNAGAYMPQAFMHLLPKKLVGASISSIIFSVVMLFVSLVMCSAADGQQFVIDSVVPLRGPAGSEVHIFSSTFNTSDIYSNIVYFGAAKAKVLGYSTLGSYLSVLVPNDATYAPISVTRNRQTATSSQKFELSFSDAGNLSEGSFAIVKTFKTGANAEKMIAGDFNLDGRADIVTLGYASQATKTQTDLSIFQNSSTVEDIQLKNIYLYHLDRQVSLGLNSADIDGDGLLDIIVSGAVINGNPSFLVFRNKTSGDDIVFEDPRVFTVPGNGKVKIADIDLDGKPDVVYLGLDSAFLLKNTSQNANISFGQPASLNVKGGTMLEIADYNNDHRPDIAVFNKANRTIYFYQNLSATMVSMSFNTKLEIGQRDDFDPSIVSGDFTGDGWMDMAILFKSSNSVALIRNKKYGSIGMEMPLGYVVKGGGMRSGALALSDVNGDGKPDLIVGNRNGTLAALQNAMAGDRFLFRDALYYDALQNISDASVVDMNGDGKPDVLFSNVSRNFIAVLKNQIGKSQVSPRLTSFSPAAGLSRDVIMITGSNFSGVRNVRFGGTDALSYSILSDSVIAAVVDSGATGAISIVSNFGTTAKEGFTYLTTPAIKITADSLSVCSGSVMRATAEVYGRYPSYWYVWYRNGHRGTGRPNGPYSSKHLKQGDSVWAILTKGHERYKSNVLRFNVNPSIRPVIKIWSATQGVACKGSKVTFNSLVNRGDTSQVFQWFKNDLPVGANSSSYSDNNLSTGDIVYCILSVDKKCDFPAKSNKLTFTIYDGKPTAPVAIMGPDAVNANEGGIKFSVNPPVGAVWYQWQIPPDATLQSDATSDSILVNWGDSAGEISVKALNVCGASAAVTKSVSVISKSEKIAARTMNNVKIPEDAVAPDFAVYPNPATSSVTILDRAKVAKGFTANLTDGNGRVIKNSSAKLKVDWSVSELAPGVYYIVITDGKKVIAKEKLLVSH